MYLGPCLRRRHRRTDATDKPVMCATSCSFRSDSSVFGVAILWYLKPVIGLSDASVDGENYFEKFRSLAVIKGALQRVRASCENWRKLGESFWTGSLLLLCDFQAVVDGLLTDRSIQIIRPRAMSFHVFGQGIFSSSSASQTSSSFDANPSGLPAQQRRPHVGLRLHLVRSRLRPRFAGLGMVGSCADAVSARTRPCIPRTSFADMNRPPPRLSEARVWRRPVRLRSHWRRSFTTRLEKIQKNAILPEISCLKS